MSLHWYILPVHIQLQRSVTSYEAMITVTMKRLKYKWVLFLESSQWCVQLHIYDCYPSKGPPPLSSTISNHPSPPRPSLEPATVTYSSPHLLPQANSGNTVANCLDCWVSHSFSSLGGLPYYWLTYMPSEVDIHAMYNRKLGQRYTWYWDITVV